MKPSTPRGGSKEVQARLAPSSLGSQQKGDPVIVSSYAYKGGSTKTTVTCYLACAIARKKKRVLLVDADHQGNTTVFFDNAPEPPEGDTTADDTIHAANGLLAMTTRCLSAVTTTPTPDTRETQPTTSTAVTHAAQFDSVWSCFSKWLRHDASRYRLKPVQTEEYKDTKDKGGPRIHLMPSSSDLEHLQPVMADNQAENIKLLRDVIIKAADEVQADFVIIDLGPTPDNLNRACVLISDVVQPTTNGNCIFNWMGAHSLITTILPKWFEFSHEKELDMFPYILPFMANRFAVEKGYVKQNDANFINGLKTSLAEFRKAITVLQRALKDENLTAELLIKELEPMVNNAQVKDLANSIQRGTNKYVNYINHAGKVLDHMLTARSGDQVEPMLPQTRHMAVCHEVGQPLFDINTKALKNYFGGRGVEKELENMRSDIKLFNDRFMELATRFLMMRDVLQKLKAEQSSKGTGDGKATKAIKKRPAAEESSNDDDGDDMGVGGGASTSKPRTTHARARSSQQAGGGPGKAPKASNKAGAGAGSSGRSIGTAAASVKPGKCGAHAKGKE
ncbi:hypothetical protein V8C86DRAFT_2783261 [Haematococcus lacustris]